MIPLSWYLILAGLLFLIGLLAVLIRKNSIGILMGVELILNAANINLLAFWRYLYGQKRGFQRAGVCDHHFCGGSR